MKTEVLKSLLHSLLINWEDEVVEFKRGGAGFSNKGLPGSRYRAMLIDYIGKFNGLSRKQINEYMIPEIRGDLSVEEKISKISNLMTYLRRLGAISNMGSATKPLWKLSDKREIPM